MNGSSARGNEKIEELLRWMEEKGNVLVALSGGVDSGVVAAIAHKALGDKALAVTAYSPAMSTSDLEDAKETARSTGIRHVLVQTHELDDPNYVRNSPDRCYFCRRELVTVLKKIQAREKMNVIVDGNNIDDLGGHRPGLKALREGGVRSPLIELGLGKEDIRMLASYLGLKVASKPSNACLSSRVAYGEKVTVEIVRRIELAELFIRGITGIMQLRVREHNGIARIEVGKNERTLMLNTHTIDAIDSKLRSMGFKYVTMDLAGYRSGSLLEDLNHGLITISPRETKVTR